MDGWEIFFSLVAAFFIFIGFAIWSHGRKSY